MKRWIRFTGIGLLLTIVMGSLFLRLPASQAQEIVRNINFDRELKVAYVSNQDGDEDIYTVAWDGWAGWATEETPVNLTSNDQSARDWNPVWSPDGAQIMFTSDRNQGLSQLYIMSGDGDRTRPIFVNSTANDLAPAWSPDGARIVFVSDRAGIGRDLYLADADGSNVTRLTTTGTLKGDPVFTPDGAGITFWERQRDGTIQLFNLNVANPADVRRLSFNGQNNGMAFWSPLGTTVYFESDRNNNYFQLYSADAQGNNARPLTDAGVHSGRGAVSPDGSLIIFTSDRFNSDELFLMNADGTALEQLTENGWSDHSPAWQPAISQEHQTPGIVIAEPTPAPLPAAGSGLTSLGQSASNNVLTYPITLQTLKNEYGIEAWHQAGWRGQGVRIGVIDLGFGGLGALQAQVGREIIIPVPEDFNAYDGDSNTHGRHVLEIIHDLAPEADLYACRYDGTLTGFQTCTDYFTITRPVDIINHSAGIPVFPLNGENEWAKTVEDLVNGETIWVNSTGNFQQSFYSRGFDDRDQDGRHDFATDAGQSVNEILFNIQQPYTGNIMLTWNDSDTVTDLSLEVVDALTGQTIQIADNAQLGETPAPPNEAIFLNNQSSPFRVQVRYNGGNRFVTFALVVEYLAINLVGDRSNLFQARSSIAPADQRSVLSVGAVRTVLEDPERGIERHVDELAPYSSYGLLDSSLIKPDISAYGELRLPDETDFFGTSAAAPVVTGALALFWQARPSEDAVSIRQQFLSDAVYQPEDYISTTYGTGVLTMPPAPPRFGGANAAEVIPKIIFPQSDVADTQNTVARCGGLLTRLEIGLEGYVTYELGLGFRTGPGTQFRDISSGRNLDLGDRFVVLDGPACDGAVSWWNVQLEDGSTGWVSEGQSYHLISPSSYTRAALPETFSLECPNAPDPLLQVGQRAEVVNSGSGGLELWNLRTAVDIIGTLGNGVQLQVLSGPYCSQGNGLRLWYVRVLSGRWEGAQGWVGEARPTQRWLAPLVAG